MATTTIQQQNLQNLPPATPRYILRGHASPIQALYFFADNTRLISADADGWVVIWDIATKRSRAVWKAHGAAVLEVKGYCERLEQGMIIYTHGRDHKLRIWRIKSSEEERLSRVLPVERGKEISASHHTDQGTELSPEPWLLHSLPVNALNFCSFTLCFLPSLEKIISSSNDGNDNSELQEKKEEKEELISTQSPDYSEPSAYFAVPNALHSGAIDIFHLPSEKRLSTIPADTSVQTGMVMAVKLLLFNNSFQESPYLCMLSGYEDGHVMVHVSRLSLSGPDSSKTWKWVKLYASRPHSQPILSLDSVQAEKKDKKKKKEESQIPRYFFLTSSADALIVKHAIPPIPSSIFSQTPTSRITVEDTPLKALNTKHSGQQGLRVRRDQKIFATAGWDARIRVYSCNTMKELAVLKWHNEGCYAVAFADIAPFIPTETKKDSDSSEKEKGGEVYGSAVQTPSPLEVVRQQRSQKAQQTHWLAAGSKDGKISLWDIY